MNSFHQAAQDGDLDVVKALLIKDPNLVFLREDSGVTALHLAALKGHKGVAAMLLSYGAKINERERAGDAPLHWAAINGHADVMELLLAKGADPNPKNINGLTPMQEAMRHGHENVTRLLRENLRQRLFGTSGDARVDQLLRTTHRACRTLKIPGVVNIFQRDSDLPLESFMEKYRAGAFAEALASFCRISPQLSPDEFLISLSYHKELRFLLSSRTLVLFDRKTKRHHVLALRECTGFLNDFWQQQQCSVRCKDGSVIQIEVTFPPEESVIKKIDAACKWASSQTTTETPVAAADYDPERVSGSLLLLRNTHRACRTLKIPDVTNMFQGEAVLPLEAFTAKYRAGAFGEALASFCRISPQLSPDEFLISLSYEKELRFLLSSHTLVLFDQRLKRHHVLALREYAGLERSGGHTVHLKRIDGSQVEVALSFVPRKPIVDSIAGMCRWASGQTKEGALFPPAADYDPDLPSSALTWYYAYRGAAWAISLPVVIFIILGTLKVTGTLFLPGFLAILGFSLAGSVGGWLYGAARQLGYRRRHRRRLSKNR